MFMKFSMALNWMEPVGATDLPFSKVKIMYMHEQMKTFICSWYMEIVIYRKRKLLLYRKIIPWKCLF